MSNTKPSFHYGYQGFRSSTRRLPESRKPGESAPSRDSKFAGAGRGVVYRSEMPLNGDKFASTAKQHIFSTVHKKDYVVPDKRGVMATRRDELPRRKFIAQSEYGSRFTDFIAETLALEKGMGSGAVRAAFDNVDRDGSGRIDRGEVEHLLAHALGHRPQPRYIDQFMTFFDADGDGRVSWAEFQGGVGKLVAHMRGTIPAQVTKRAEPAFETKAVPKVIGQGPITSSLRRDMGGRGGNPRQRAFVDGSGMTGTTKELDEGTSKHSRAIPGYGGYLASATFNEHAVRQTAMEGTRDYLTKVHISDTYAHNPPGYTGHAPRSVSNPVAARGPTSLTSTGSAMQEVTRMWDARRNQE